MLVRANSTTIASAISLPCLTHISRLFDRLATAHANVVGLVFFQLGEIEQRVVDVLDGASIPTSELLAVSHSHIFGSAT